MIEEDDMSTRVDEKRDQQRADEQKALEKAAAKKQAEHSRQFDRVMQRSRGGGARQVVREAGRQASSRDRTKQSAARGQASSRLAAKQGIATQAFRGQLESAGDDSLRQKGATGLARREELAGERDARVRRDEARGDETREGQRAQKQEGDRLAAIDRDDPRRRGDGGGRDGGNASSGDQSNDGREAAARQATEAAAGGPIGTAGAAPGAPTERASGASSDTSTRASQLAAVIQQLVKHVMQGVDAKGLGVMHVELKDDVLAGARLTITAGGGGVSLKVATHDRQVARLLSSGQAAHELSGALRGRGLRLDALVVNDSEVLRS